VNGISRRLARVIAAVLLSWTVADLSYFQCCLGDETRGSVGTQITAAWAGDTAHSDTDDCFCCARCLDTGLRLDGFRHAPEWTDFQEPAAHLATRPAALDHPPQRA
jgi:hypothetical protein